MFTLHSTETLLMASISRVGWMLLVPGRLGAAGIAFWARTSWLGIDFGPGGTAVLFGFALWLGAWLSREASGRAFSAGLRRSPSGGRGWDCCSSRSSSLNFAEFHVRAARISMRRRSICECRRRGISSVNICACCSIVGWIVVSTIVRRRPRAPWNSTNATCAFSAPADRAGSDLVSRADHRVAFRLLVMLPAAVLAWWLRR